MKLDTSKEYYQKYVRKGRLAWLAGEEETSCTSKRKHEIEAFKDGWLAEEHHNRDINPIINTEMSNQFRLLIEGSITENEYNNNILDIAKKHGTPSNDAIAAKRDNNVDELLKDL